MKIKPIVKVLTFMDAEAFILIVSMVLSVIFGTIYIKRSITHTQILTKEIISSENDITDLNQRFNDFIYMDNLLLSESLDGKNIKSDLSKFSSYRDSFDMCSNTLDTLIGLKVAIFEEIYTYKMGEKDMNIKQFRSYKKVPKIINQNIKRGLHKSEVSDTTFTTMVGTDIQKMSESIKTSKIKDDKAFQEYIYQNNTLTLQMSLVINEYKKTTRDESIESQKDILRELNRNFRRYVIASVVLFSLFFLFIVRLIIDIRKVLRSDSRSKSIVAIMLEKFNTPKI